VLLPAKIRLGRVLAATVAPTAPKKDGDSYWAFSACQQGLTSREDHNRTWRFACIAQWLVMAQLAIRQN
jgi:hypothetical protein